MTIENILNSSIAEAVIYFKNGTRKYGILLDSPVNDEFYQFISNDNVNSFQETYSSKYIENIGQDEVEAIDRDLK